MAKIGLKYPVMSKYSEVNGVPTYKNGLVIGKAIKADLTINNNDASLDADDDTAESDKSFIDGTLSLNVDDLDYEVQAMALGHQVYGTRLVANANDVSPFVGVAFYGPVVRKNVRKYRAVHLKKVQFAEPSESLQTKGKTMAYQTPVIPGTIMKDCNDDWKEEEIFLTEAEAIAWVKSVSNVTGTCGAVRANVPAGVYTQAQEVELSTATEGATIYYTTNGTTPSATNGTAYSSAISIEETTMLRAVAIKASNSNSVVFDAEYVIND